MDLEVSIYDNSKSPQVISYLFHDGRSAKWHKVTTDLKPGNLTLLFRLIYNQESLNHTGLSNIAVTLGSCYSEGK